MVKICASCKNSKLEAVNSEWYCEKGLTILYYNENDCELWEDKYDNRCTCGKPMSYLASECWRCRSDTEKRDK
jgi:hypothetical protein